MATNEWYVNLESKIFTIVKKRMSVDFPDVYMTTMESNNIDTKLPSVLIREMYGIERGFTLDNSDVSAVLFTMQIRVTAKSKTEVSRIASAVAKQFKRLRFTLTSLPVYTQDGDKICSYFRVRRLIGSGDNDIV